MSESDIINRIKELMAEKNISINMLAKKSDIAQSTLSSMMNRENLPTLPTLTKICEGLNITLPQFFMQESDYVLTLTDNQSAMLSVYNSLTDDNQYLLFSIAKDILTLQKSK